MQTIRALVKTEPGVGLQLQDIPLPELRPNHVRIRVLKSSICGTDLHIYEWDDWAARTIQPPMAIGHEYVGVVDAVGSNVHDHFPGELVTGEGHLVCGHCRNCLAGRRHLCPNTRGVGVDRPGAFAEYISIPVANVWHCDPNIPLDILSCFDPFGNATHTALSFNMVGEDVLITGAGPIGLMATAIARHVGARHVVVTDLTGYRRKLAARMGATLALDPGQYSLQEIMAKLGMKEGFDVGLEMSGSPQALVDMLAAMCHGGKIALLGLLPTGAGIDWDKVIFHGLTIKGIYGREMFETWYKMTTMVQSGLDIAPVITHRFPYHEFEQGFALMRSGQCGKVILDWAEAEND
ncbi:MAG: L-threonine 3-dehydrogenase [Anaerolineales bacterium]|jgi:threonine 3-dehydrogenase|nr:L-threonine 3-dehydrogenase [Anaerolineales bacterium]|tara:strand:+ start:1309 stop:2358 length:1050 start_codon:yes stop_codon:yes gene_type:complete